MYLFINYSNIKKGLKTFFFFLSMKQNKICMIRTRPIKGKNVIAIEVL